MKPSGESDASLQTVDEACFCSLIFYSTCTFFHQIKTASLDPNTKDDGAHHGEMRHFAVDNYWAHWNQVFPFFPVTLSLELVPPSPPDAPFVIVPSPKTVVTDAPFALGAVDPRVVPPLSPPLLGDGGKLRAFGEVRSRAKADASVSVIEKVARAMITVENRMVRRSCLRQRYSMRYRCLSSLAYMQRLVAPAGR